MAFKLTNAQVVELSKLRDAVASAAEQYGTALLDIATEAREAYEEKSDKWRESDAGTAADEWINELEAAAESTEFDIPDPEALRGA